MAAVGGVQDLIAAINRAFDALVAEIKTREGDGGNVALYSRVSRTAADYEARIDDLFAGSKANLIGARVLDRSDLLDMLAFGDGPVELAEGKVIAGRSAHPGMTAEVWKKVPQWLDNPAAVFESDTVPGRLVAVAPESIAGSPVPIVVEPNTERGKGVVAHLMVNAYDAQGGKTPFGRWVREGLLRYADQKTFPALLANTSGLQLPGTAYTNKPGTKRILTQKNLVGYRETRQSVGAPGTTGATAGALRARLADEFGADVIDALEKAGLLRITDRPAGAPADAVGETRSERIALYPGADVAVAYHEALHAALRQMIGDAAFDALMARMPMLAAGNRKWFAEAAGRIPADTPKAARNSELASYAVEQYQRAREAMPAGRAQVGSGLHCRIEDRDREGPAGGQRRAEDARRADVRCGRLAQTGARWVADDGARGRIRFGLPEVGTAGAFSSMRPEEAFRRDTNTRDEIRLAREAHARIAANNGVALRDDLRDMVRVPGYSQWSESALVGNVDATTALRGERDAAFKDRAGRHDWARPIVNDPRREHSSAARGARRAKRCPSHALA